MPFENSPSTTINNNPDISTLLGRNYNVILFNDEIHSMEEVVLQIIRAVNAPRPQGTGLL